MKRLLAPLLAFLIGTLIAAGVAAPPVQTIVASLSVPSGGSIVDVNALSSSVPVVNALGKYIYTVPSPSASDACLKVLAGANLLSPIFGNGCTPYPTPVPTSANANCSWAGYTMNCATPTPLPSLHGEIVFALPQVTPAVGTSAIPVYINPNYKNPVFTGSHLQCANAGSGTGTLSWNFIYATGADRSGTLTTAAPIPTMSVAASTSKAGGATAAPTAMPTDSTVGNPNTWYDAQISAIPATTVQNTNCSITLEFNYTP